MNLKSTALLSPNTKMTLAVVPYQLDVEITRELVLKELKDLEDTGLTIENADGTNTNFFVRLAFISGDSKDLNGFIGLGNFNSKFGCRTCWVDRDSLQDYEKTFPEKTAMEIISIHADATTFQRMNEPKAVIYLIT
jgi:hypothetical protein